MSTENQTPDTQQATTNTIREALLNQCDLLGIPYQSNTPTTKLQELVAQKTKDSQVPTQTIAIQKSSQEVVVEYTPEQIAQAKRIASYEAAMQMVRVVVVSLNPGKSDLEGELFTFGNSLVPTQSKYVPFNREDGWHIPRILVEILRDKRYQGYRTIETDGVKRKTVQQLPAYSVTELPPLSVNQLKDMQKVFGQGV